MERACTIVTLTGFQEIFWQFWASAERYEVGTPKMVVTSRGITVSKPRWRTMVGMEPFVFARNANLGLSAASPNDVLLVNDDVQFIQFNTVEMLKRIAYSDEKIGILSPQFYGLVGSKIQKRSTKLTGLTYAEETLCFTCVYLKRSVINAVGLLDERFTGYGCEDDDYCLRVRQAGLTLAVTPGVFVKHGFGKANATASYEKTHDVDTEAEKMREVFAEKWGFRPDEPR